jgi:hypothetical protein
MSISYEIDPRSGVVRLQFRSEATFTRTIEVLHALANDPRLPETLDMLVDLRESPPLPDSAQLRTIVSELGRLGPELRLGACALVASSDSHYGMSRMFAVYAERAFAAVQVFREPAEAEAWLSANRAHASGSTS